MISKSQARKIGSLWWSKLPSHKTAHIPSGTSIYGCPRRIPAGWVIEFRRQMLVGPVWEAKITLDHDGKIIGERMRERRAAA